MKTIILFMCLLCVAKPSYSQEMQVSTDAKITMITEDFPPLNFIQEGQLCGPAVEIVQEIFKRLDVTSEILVRPWARGYATTVNTANTCLFSTARTEEREALFKWVGPLAEKKYAFYAKKGANITINTLEDAQNYTIGVQRGGVNEQYLTSQGFKKMTGVTKPIQNLERLLKGRIDLWYTSSSTIADLCQKLHIQPNEVEEVYVSQKIMLYIACNKETSEHDLQRLQRAYDAIYEDRTVRELFEKYKFESMYISQK